MHELIIRGLIAIIIAGIVIFAVSSIQEQSEDESLTQAHAELDKFIRSCSKWIKFNNSTASVHAQNFVLRNYISPNSYTVTGTGTSSTVDSLTYRRDVSFAPSGSNTTCNVVFTFESVNQCNNIIDRLSGNPALSAAPTCATEVMTAIVRR